MKNKIMFGMAIVAVAALNGFFAGGPRNVLSIFSLANLEALAMSNNDEGDYNGEKCDAGGPGSKGCSIETGQMGTERKCSVDCGGEYYSCCYITALLSAKCRCVRIE